MSRSLLAVVFVLLLAGCSRDSWQRSPGPDDAMKLVPWFAFMEENVAIQPYKMNRMPAEGAVPIDGIEPPLQVLPENFPAINALRNPAQRTAESLETGRKYYEIFCQPCHGATGAGDGPVNEKMFVVQSLLTQKANDLSDGMIYSIIRHGRGVMRAYGEGVRGIDRWHVVNYVRQLQGATR
ncbi:MAG: cytochrome c [Gemmatimonadota bacterium]|nr:MAG: cytochrome c [Gemmatimonadota bacterium]